MYSLRALVTILLLHTAIPAEAADFAWKSGVTVFMAYQGKVGNGQVENALKTCVEKDLEGRIKVKAVPCVLDVTTWLFGAAVAFFGPGWGIAEIYDQLPAQETKASGHPPTRRSTHNQNFLDAFNKQLSDHLPDDSIQAHAIVPSDVHPHDGLAFKMNIHSDNSTLHMHTNGTHMMAKFHEDDEHELARRKVLPTNGRRFFFDKVAGIKLEWRNVNHDPNGFKDFPDILSRWVGTAAKILPPPILAASMWDFQACNTAKTATFFYGRIRFDAIKPKLHYEHITPRGCSG